MANSKITVESLNLHYGENHALKNVNMEIADHAITAFIGPSQKPDGVIEINVYDRTMYLWYYDDLKSDKRGNNLSYSVDVPE